MLANPCLSCLKVKFVRKADFESHSQLSEIGPLKTYWSLEHPANLGADVDEAIKLSFLRSDEYLKHQHLCVRGHHALNWSQLNPTTG